ncbi:hypothetical protein Tco_0922305, partial [Tanacetum coccineum]
MEDGFGGLGSGWWKIWKEGNYFLLLVRSNDNVEPIRTHQIMLVAVEIEAPGALRAQAGGTVVPKIIKRLRADYGITGGSAAGGKSPSVLNRLLQASQITVEQGIPALPTLPFITSSVTALPLEEGGDHTDFVTGPSLRTVGPSARFIVLSDSSHHSGAKSTDSEVDSFVRSVAPVMTTATTVTAFVSNAATTTATPVDVVKDKDVPTPSIFASSSSSDKTDRTLSLFTGKSGSDFVARSIYARGDADVDLQEIYIPEWSVTKLFAEFNVSAARNLSLSFEVRMRAEYNISEKRKWKSLAEEKNNLLQVKDKEIEELSLEAIKGSLRGEVASAKEHNGLLEQERSALKLKVTGLESINAEKDSELSDLGTSSSSLRS